MTPHPSRTLPLLCLMVFFLLLSTGTQFPTLNPFGESLGGSAAQLGWLWFWFAAPRALFGPLWASVSDVWGRRPIFILGSLGMIAGSTVWALANSFEMLLLSRILDSALSAQAAVAFAVVADITPPEKRASSMGLLGVSASLAFIVGPVFGAFFASAYSLAALGWLNAGLQGTALLLAIFFLPESAPRRGNARFELPILQPRTWSRIARLPSVPVLLLTILIFTVSYTHFNTAFQLGSKRLFGFDERMVGVAWMILGLCAAISQGGLVRQLVPRLGETTTAGMGIAGSVVGFILMSAAPAPAVYWVATAILGLGVGLALAALNGLISLSAPANDQGIIQGFNQSAQQLGRSIGPVLGSTGMAVFNPRIPFAIAAAIGLISLIGIVMLKRGAKGTEGT